MGKIPGISGPDHIVTKQLRIAELARRMPDRVLTSLAHHIDVAWMYEAYRRTKKGGATGVDGQSAADFEKNLMDNLRALVEGLKSGSYKPPPVGRKYLKKKDGGQRPIGVPTFSDKVLQRAVSMLLEPLYEQDFHEFSYGFRPSRSAHQAIDAMRDHLWEIKGGWLVEVDIKGFFDGIDHAKLRECLAKRMGDGVLKRAIDKWLRAGVMEDGVILRSEKGTPQGGVISPLLANIFLHEVMDDWFAKVVKPRVGPAARMVRYADDILVIVQTEKEAQRVLAATRNRFAKFGLELHPEKSKIVDFTRPPWKGSPKGAEPGTFNFLGFTFYWGKSQKGFPAIMNRTRKESLRAGLKEISAWCEKNRHEKVAWQFSKLNEKLRGHYGYFGRRGNIGCLTCFRHQVGKIWRFWLNRRSQQRHLSWTKFYVRLKANPLLHPWITHR